MKAKQSYIERFVRWAFGSIIERAVNAAVTVRVDDSPGWTTLGDGPTDRPWSEKYEDLKDTLDAWRKSFLIRRIVTLTHAYVVGNGITITSKIPEVEEFVQKFWKHPKNRMDARLVPICDELTRSGEVFPVLFTNPVDGMSYIRLITAHLINHIETKKDDLEAELWYEQQTTLGAPKKWTGIASKEAFEPKGKRLEPLMLHYTINRPVGATRGESDLTPILPWAKRYSEWLKDRVRLNRRRTKQAIVDVEIKDGSKVEAKRKQLRTNNPLETGIYVHGDGEKITLRNLNIDAADAKDDGKALRLAVSTGAILGPHHLGEGESINLATAKAMDEPTARFHTNRQKVMTQLLLDITATAYMRAVATGKARAPEDGDLQMSASVVEAARVDNENLAKAARDIVRALARMKKNGWIDDRTAIALSFKFAGETISESEIDAIIKAVSEGNGEDEEIEQ